MAGHLLQEEVTPEIAAASEALRTLQLRRGAALTRAASRRRALLARKGEMKLSNLRMAVDHSVESTVVTRLGGITATHNIETVDLTDLSADIYLVNRVDDLAPLTRPDTNLINVCV